jgi:molybdopterin synthase catalytic subunit
VTYLVRRPIDQQSLIRRVAAPDRGGIACFLGTVRNHHTNREVRRLSYTAYEPMAEAECQRLLDEAKTRWPVAMALEHRLGDLAIGDVAVAVVAAAAHREPAFEACRYVMDQLKHRVPIWKREHYGDGSVAWVDPTGAQAPGPPAEVTHG